MSQDNPQKTAQHSSQQALLQLSQFVQFEKKLRAATELPSLTFTLVNELFTLFSYQHAYVWQHSSGKIISASGLQKPDNNAPAVNWLNRQCKYWSTQSQIQTLTRKNCAQSPHPSSDDTESHYWQQLLSGYLIYVPLLDSKGQCLGALLLSRDAPLTPQQTALLELVQHAAQYSWQALTPKHRYARWLRPKRISLILAALVGLALLLPIRQSALAPAELVAVDPAIIRAPLQGVVATLLVKPNTDVKAGQALLKMDDRALNSDLQAAKQSLAIADAEYRQAQQQALYDARSKASLAVLKGRRDQANTRVEFLQQQRDQLLIVSPKDGVAIIDDANEWIGRPVNLGEKILQVAQPSPARLKIDLPINDAIGLTTAAPIRFFMNTDPTHPVSAQLEQLGYRAHPTLDGTLAYQLKGKIAEEDQTRVRVGLKGTARIYGEKTTLFNYLLRRPIHAVQIWLSL